MHLFTRPDRASAAQFRKYEAHVAYNAIVADLMNHPSVRQMDLYVHHGSVTCLEHCLSVSYYSFRLSRWLHLDQRSAARGGLLHDLYLYDWHTSHPVRGLHGLTHPRTALNNASRHFKLNRREQDAILCHMWPLTPRLPRTTAAWLICLMDKYCAVAEVFRLSGRLRLFPHNPSGRLVFAAGREPIRSQET